MCIDRFVCVRGFFILVLCALSIPGQLWARESMVRFASNRMVAVHANVFNSKSHAQCRLIHQQDGFDSEFLQYHLHAEGTLRIADMAVGFDDTILAAGVFSGVLSFNGVTLQAESERDVFYLLLDAQGDVLAFQNFNGSQWRGLFSVEINAYGDFELQGAALGEDRIFQPLIASVDQSGHFLGVRLSNFHVSLNPSDKEGIDDPYAPVPPTGTPLDQNDEEEVGDPGAPIPPGEILLDQNDEEEVGDPGAPIPPGTILLDQNDEEVGDPGAPVLPPGQ